MGWKLGVDIMVYRGWYDGSANPNPGKLGLGIAIYQDSTEILCGAKPAGKGTNNEAEYLALIFLLEMALEHEIKYIVVYGDSQLITNQVNGVWGVGKEALKRLHKRVLTLKRNFENIEFVWRKREKNKRADQLSKRGGELTEPKIWFSDCLKNDTENDFSVDPINTPICENKITPVDNKSVTVISINRTTYLISDNFGISKLILSPKLRCTCMDFYQKGNCIHSKSVDKLRSDLLSDNQTVLV